MQVSYGLCLRNLVDLTYLKLSVENLFLVVPFIQHVQKKQPFSIKHTAVYDD